MLTHSDLPKVSVVIPVFNDADGLKKTLTALQAQDYPKDKLEIIVVDNNSSDGSDQVALSFKGVTVTYEKNIQNAGAARNKGLTIAKGEVIAFTDADCIPKENWITEGVSALQNQKVDRVAGQILIEPVTPQSSAATLLDATYNFNQKLLITAYDAAITANLFVRQFVFAKIGIFHTDYFEDIEFNRRASLANLTLAYAPKCIVIHPPRQTFKAVWKKGKRSGRGVFSICQKENLGGWLGWKHPFRVIKNLLLPRKLHWERLSVSKEEISLSKQFQVYLLVWLAINLPESLGYTEWLLKTLRQNLIKIVK